MAILYYPGMRYDTDGGVDSRRSLINQLKIIQTSDTSIQITVPTDNFEFDPTYYVVVYKSENAFSGTTLDPNPTTDTFNITGLARNNRYEIQVTAYFQEGSTVVSSGTLRSFYKMDEEIAGGTVLGQSSNPLNVLSNNNGGYLTLSSGQKEDKSYTVATRSFDAIVLPESTATTVSGSKNKAPSYKEKYYAFGTSLVFSSIVADGAAGAGIGFFTDDRANVGYYLLLDTTVSAGSSSKKAVQWVKIENGKNAVRPLASTTEAGLISGEVYNVDIRVKISGFTITMVAYINGAMITASDKTIYNTSTKKINKIVPPTQKITLLCTRGKVYFDYVYGKEVDKTYYEDSSRISKRYYGQYANDFIETAFGNLNFTETSEDSNNGKEFIDEFGNTVREIKYIDVKYNGSPAQPIGASNGIQYATSILAQDLTNFSSKIWVLNNSSVTTPLSGNGVTFWIYGNQIQDSQSMYSTGDESDYSIIKPVTFETAWIQRNEDAESLGEWIKKSLINKGRIVNMSIFGNPLIQIGDIVSINYQYQGYNGTEAFIVTSISHSYSNGIQTDLVCRTI